MLPKILFVLLTVVSLTVAQNSTDDLEVRVTLLEDDVADLQDELEEVETANTLQDQRFDNVEDDVSGNSDDIEGLTSSVDELQITSLQLVERMDDVESLVALLQQAVTGLLDSVEDLQSTDVQTDQRVSTLEQSSNETNDRVASLETGLFNVEVTLNSTIGELNDVNTLVATLEDSVADLEAANVEFEDRIDDLEEIISAPWEACTSSPCENGATCVDVNLDTFVCACRDGFFGVTCDTSYSETTFLATIGSIAATPTNPMVFDLAIINAGGFYNTATGIYTVPVDGVYEFTIHLLNTAESDDSAAAYLVVDNTRVSFIIDTDTNATPVMEGNTLLTLTSGQQIWVEPLDFDSIGGATVVSGMVSWFSGQLISAL